ncbi:hypothetical protein OAH12_02485 [Cyclobacteriaceae bacterium]|nr:hypothetical protein [Cyclobacteriaceae bacterium]
MKFFNSLSLIALLFLTSAFIQKLPLANQKVIEYVDSVMGTKVGTGECADVVFNAQHYLKKDNVYTHSKSKKTLAGDFITFRDVVFLNSNGGKLTFYDHQAVVYKVLSKTKIIIAHQNHNGKKVVQTLKLDLGTHQSGVYGISHP